MTVLMHKINGNMDVVDTKENKTLVRGVSVFLFEGYMQGLAECAACIKEWRL